MGFRKLIFAFLLLEGCCVFSQYVQAPGACSCVSSRPSCSVTPAGQFVIPAIIKPILQPEPIAVASPAPVIPSYSNIPAPAPFGGMPPIILDDENTRSDSLMYCLLLALARRNRFGGNGFGSCGGYSNCGGCGNCGECGSYSGSSYCGGCSGGCNGGCNSGCYGSCSNNNGCGGCGCNNGCGVNNGNCGCGGFNGNGCGNGYTFIPYPIPVSCGSSTGFSTFDCGCTNNDNSCNQTPGVNLIIRTADDTTITT